MEYKHSKFFAIFYAIALLMMGTPLINIANEPVMFLGMPMLLTWICGWTLLATIVLIIQYKMDTKADSHAKENSEN